MMKELNVIYLADNNYVPYAGVSLLSLFENNKQAEKIKVYYMAHALEKENIVKLEKLVDQYKREIQFIDTKDIDDFLEKQKVPKYLGKSYASLYRWFAIGKIKDDIEYAIYIDADTVIQKGLEKIDTVLYQEKPVYMAIDYMWDFYKQEINMEVSDKYYNTGVILFDVKKWKKDMYEQQIINFIKNEEMNFVFYEQDMANIVMKNAIGMLPLKYNAYAILRWLKPENLCKAIGLNEDNYYTCDEIKRSYNEAIVLHCSVYDGTRPWNRNTNHPYREQFDMYMQMSPWKDFEKKKVDIGVSRTIQKILHKILPQALFCPILRLGQYLHFKKLCGNLKES